MARKVAGQPGCFPEDIPVKFGVMGIGTGQVFRNPVGLIREDMPADMIGNHPDPVQLHFQFLPEPADPFVVIAMEQPASSRVKTAYLTGKAVRNSSRDKSGSAPLSAGGRIGSRSSIEVVSIRDC